MSGIAIGALAAIMGWKEWDRVCASVSGGLREGTAGTASPTWRAWFAWRIKGRAKRSRNKTRTEVPLMHHDIELIALDGANLLAYLAALGTLRVLTFADVERNVRMSWVDRGFWRPVVHHASARTAEELVAMLEKRVCGEESI